MTTIATELRQRELPLPSRKTLVALLAAAATVVFGWLFLRQGSLGEAWTAMRAVPLELVAVALAAIGGAMWFTAVRWGGSCSAPPAPTSRRVGSSPCSRPALPRTTCSPRAAAT